MEPPSHDASSPGSLVKITLRIGPETHTVHGNKGLLSEQLVTTKSESMVVLKDYITRHNVPNDVADEPLEDSSGEDDEIPEKPPVKSKKRK